MAICCIRRSCSNAASTLCAKISAANSRKPSAISAASNTKVSKMVPPNHAKNDTHKFEELPGSNDPESPTEPTNNTSNTNHTSSYPQEDLITDAEYEEIPN